jgi:hypothetical protein
MSYDELHDAYHKQADVINALKTMLGLPVVPNSNDDEDDLTLDGGIDYGTTVVISQGTQMGDFKYTVLQRDEFTYYVRSELFQHIDIMTDSPMMLTQMSDYVFERFYTNSGTTSEDLMVIKNLKAEGD